MEEITDIAHVNSVNVIQRISEHAAGTAYYAAKFAAIFGCKEWGEVLGLWHDMGKYSPAFQQYIRKCAGLLEEGEKTGKVDHTSAGAIYANEVMGMKGIPLAYCIAGHHAGLLNWYNDIGISGDMRTRLQKDSLDVIRSTIKKQIVPRTTDLPLTMKLEKSDLHSWIRMLFSCLVDADYLDTERFMRPEISEKRSHFATIEVLKQQFDTYMTSLQSSATSSFINEKRTEVLLECCRAAQQGKQCFYLTVPTGGGKTLSSLAFALEHAVKYGKNRIIVAIPYTSIIAQTAKVFKSIFGEDNVIEHHSNIDDDALTTEQKQATENWDAPLIVTTNVQLFESLYANRSSYCRKLHNLVNSIIILDEAQMLPTAFLRPITSVLNTLVKLFDVTLLCTTATQPLLAGSIGTGKDAFIGLRNNPTLIVTDAESLNQSFRRVTIELPVELNEVTSFDDIADELKEYPQVLCIVNTRKESQALFSKMPVGTLHLSRMMCSAHIMDTIKIIKDRLARKESVRIISTQLIEAGVDIDFPVVYRAFAGLDSVAQAAGRCNREGKLNKEGKLGRVKIFNSENGIPSGYMRKGADTLKELIEMDKEIDLLSPTVMTRYFDLLYSKITNFDKAEISEKLYNGACELKFQFATAAHDFKLIDDGGCKSFIVCYGDGINYIEQLKRNGLETWILRKLQQYSVSVRESDFKELKKYGYIESCFGIWIQSDANLYHSQSGVMLNNHWLNEVFIL
ncbi:MAG: CRISPR-associated helicase Cas3' [Bacteroides sp.]